MPFAPSSLLTENPKIEETFFFRQQTNDIHKAEVTMCVIHILNKFSNSQFHFLNVLNFTLGCFVKKLKKRFLLLYIH